MPAAKKAERASLREANEFVRYQNEVFRFLHDIRATADPVEVTTDYGLRIKMPRMEGAEIRLSADGSEDMRVRESYSETMKVKLCVKSYFPDTIGIPSEMILAVGTVGRLIRPDDVTVTARLSESSDPKEYRFGGYDMNIRIKGRSVEFTSEDNGDRQVDDKACEKARERLEAAARKHRLIPKRIGED